MTAVSAQLVFLAGTYTGYQFSSSGTVTGSRLYSLSRAEQRAPPRKALTSAGMTYYYVSAGIWAGYWMPAGSGLITVTSTALTPVSAMFTYPVSGETTTKGPRGKPGDHVDRAGHRHGSFHHRAVCRQP